MEHKAFTSRAQGRLNVIKTPAGVFAVATGQSVVPKTIEQFDALWDTGATNTAISSKVAKKLGLKPITFAPVGTGGGVVNAPVHLVNIALPNNVIVTNVQVTELKELNSCDILIGMDIITQGDFAITHVGGKYCFSFRTPSHRPIDFIPESNLHNMKLKRTNGKATKPKAKSKKKKK